MKGSKEVTIEKTILAVQSDLAAVRAEHANASLKLVDAPGDKKLLAQLEALESEIGEHERKIKRLRGAMAEAAKRDTAEARAAELQRLKQQREELTKSRARLGDLAREIVAAIEKLGPLVAAYQTASDDSVGFAHGVMKACLPLNEFIRRYQALSDVIRGNAGLRAIVIDALYATGLGRSGLRLHPWVEVQPVRATKDLEEVLHDENEKIRITLDQLIARREAELLGKKAPK